MAFWTLLLSIALLALHGKAQTDRLLPIEAAKSIEFRPITIRPDLVRLIDPRNGGSASNPGIKVRLSEKGLSYINRIAGDILNEEIRKAEIPDVSKSFSKGRVEAHNIRITSFSSPAFNYRLISPNRLEWSLQNGAISVSGRWSGKYKQWITIRGSGGVSATAKNVRVALSASMHKNSQGKPKLENVQCSASMSLSLKINGGVIGWILNKFNDQIEDKLRPTLVREICKMAKKFASEDVNKKLATLPTQSTLEHYYNIDYRLMADPSVGSNYVETSHKGEIRHRSASSTPFQPHRIQQSNSNSRMLYIWVSDYLLNSLFHHAHQRNLSQFVVNENSLPHLGSFLRPSCPAVQLCLGTLFPEIESEYANAKGEIVAKTLSDPIAMIREDNGTVSGTGSLEIFIKHAGRRFRLLKATMYGSVDLTVHLKDTETNNPKLWAEAAIRTLTVNKVESDYIQQEDMQMYVDFTRPLVEDQVNEFLSQGLPILVTRGAHVKNLQLRFKPRTLEVAADLNYTG